MTKDDMKISYGQYFFIVFLFVGMGCFFGWSLTETYNDNVMSEVCAHQVGEGSRFIEISDGNIVCTEADVVEHADNGIIVRGVK